MTPITPMTPVSQASKALLPHVRADIRDLDRDLDNDANARDTRCGVTVDTRRTGIDGKSICVLADSGRATDKSE